METRKIGSLEVSVLGLGCNNFGRRVDEAGTQRVVDAAIDAGVNHFDNADVYGNGRAERMLARVFDKLGVKSTDFVIATKIGHFPGTAEHAYEPAHIRHQCEQSLINLKRDYIDVYYLHHGDFGPNAKYLEGAAAVLDSLVAEGKIRVKGQSAYSAADFERAVPIVKPAVLQSWANALDDQFIRPGSRVSNLLEKYGMTYVAFSPLAQARLLDKYDPANPPAFEPGDHRLGNSGFGAEAIAALKPKLARLKQRFGDTTEDLAAMALGYVLAQPHVACVIPGFRNERQAKCNLAADNRTFTDDDIAVIRETLA